jgi:hypothetical protein
VAPARFVRGEEVNPTASIFRTLTRINTAAAGLAQVSKDSSIGVAAGQPERVIHRIHPSASSDTRHR